MKPDILAFLDGDKMRDPAWRSDVCVCGAVSMPNDLVERTVDGITHGLVCCYVGDLPYDPAEDPARAEREALMDWEDSR